MSEPRVAIRRAAPRDVPSTSALLLDAKLPSAGVAERLDGFVVAEAHDVVVGVVGLEVYGAAALLRSLAVAPANQRRGLAAALCDQLEAQASNRGVADLYLLTETAQAFFSKRGYLAISRSQAPAEIAASQEFSQLCPQSAVFMRRKGLPRG